MAILCVEVRESEEGLSPGWMRQEMGALWVSLFLNLHAYELFSSIDVTGHKERIQRLWESVKPASGLGSTFSVGKSEEFHCLRYHL